MNFNAASHPLFRQPPVTTLLARIRAEQPAVFDLSQPIRLSRAPGRLDVMGGIADYTGSLVCEMPLACATVAAIQPRTDGELILHSFNLADDNRVATVRIPMQSICQLTAEQLAAELYAPDRKWGAYVAGCLYALNEAGLVDLGRQAPGGFSIALLSDVPEACGVSSSAAMEVAIMMGFRDHFDLLHPAVGRSLRIIDDSAFTPMKLAALCQLAENKVVGAPCGIMDQVTSVWGQADSLLQLVCQPHELQDPLPIPAGVRFVGISSAVKHNVGGQAYTRTRCAAFMAHKMILERMRQIGAAAGRRLVRDPLNGYLANLDPDDYKKIFRPYLAESILGKQFLDTFGDTIDPVTKVDPDVEYAIQHAADHHVLEAGRVKKFVRFLKEAAEADDVRKRGFALDKAGHLMYASHLSYTMDAMLGAPECDLIVKLVRHREKAGLYGARISGGGSGGTVVALADMSPRADDAIIDILLEYQQQSGNKPQLIQGSGPGAWHVGTVVV